MASHVVQRRAGPDLTRHTSDLGQTHAPPLSRAPPDNCDACAGVVNQSLHSAMRYDVKQRPLVRCQSGPGVDAEWSAHPYKSDIGGL